MSCPNCKVFHSKCKAECCQVVPFERLFFINNFLNIVRPVISMQDLPGGHVVPLTETGKCPFLKEDLGCNIYKNRPEICMKFGDETHINMTCAYQTKNGRARSTKETMKINTSQQAYLNNYL